MLDGKTRLIKDALLGPLERVIPRTVHPDTITWSSLVPGLASAILAGFGLWGWAFTAFVINRILDGLDGMVARSRVLQSDFGGYLDILVDFVVYAAIPIGIWVGARSGDPTAGDVGGYFGGGTALPLIILLSMFYVNAASWMYLSAIIEKRRRGGETPAQDSLTAPAPSAAPVTSPPPNETTTISMPAGIIEGTETVIFYALFLLFPRYYAPLYLIMAFGTAAGVIQRLLWARREFT